MKEEHKRANEQYFRKILSLLNDGGLYTYPAIQETYTVKGGVFYGVAVGVSKMKEITPKDFHKHIKLKDKKND